MSYPSLEKYLETKGRNWQYVFLLAFLFGDPSIKKKKTWEILSVLFFKHYREEILRYCGYDTGPLNLERIRVTESKLFIEYLSGMFRNGMFEECSYEELAEFIHLVFNTGHEPTTICNLLKAAHEDYQHIHSEIKTEMKKEPERKNGFLNN